MLSSFSFVSWCCGILIYVRKTGSTTSQQLVDNQAQLIKLKTFITWYITLPRFSNFYHLNIYNICINGKLQMVDGDYDDLRWNSTKCLHEINLS